MINLLFWWTSIHLHNSYILTMDVLSSVDSDRIWVFGYGSLTWKPGIEYSGRLIGYIKGYKRRFWQGNTTHRGTKEKIGRVATLIPDKRNVVWGVAYEICGVEAVTKALAHLCLREMTLGGYSVINTTFYPRDEEFKSQSVIVYMATHQNDLYLGEQHIETMAAEIHVAKGTAGPNSEYVTKLADFIRDHIPEDNDRHLFELDFHLRKLESTRKTRETIHLADSDQSDEELFINGRQT